MRRKHKNDETKKTNSSAFRFFKDTMKEVANPTYSRFHEWDNDSLKSLLVENNVQIRGSANASHATLVRICDEVFGPYDEQQQQQQYDYEDQQNYAHDEYSDDRNDDNGTTQSGSVSTRGGIMNLNSSFTFEDLAQMNWAAMKIQRLFIASRKRMYEQMFSQQQHQQQQQQQLYQQGYYNDQDQYQDHEYDGDEYHQYDNLPEPTAPPIHGDGGDGDDDIEQYDTINLQEQYSNDSYEYSNDDQKDMDSLHMVESNNESIQNQMARSRRFHHTDEYENDELDEELDTEWRKPSWKFAKKFEAENRPHKSGKQMKKYDWRKDTLGRHCTMGGCGEQLDLWDEGATSEFSQFGSGITNYFKVCYFIQYFSSQ